MGNQALEDSMVSDGLIDKFNDYHMGITAENLVENMASVERNKTNSQPNHNKRRRMQETGGFDAEIVPVEVPQRKGDPIIVSQDEGIRQGTTADKLGKLRPAFKKMVQ